MNITYINPVIAGLNVCSVLIDVFKEAQHAGEVPPGYNPAQATKQPRNRITKQNKARTAFTGRMAGDIQPGGTAPPLSEMRNVVGCRHRTASGRYF